MNVQKIEPAVCTDGQEGESTRARSNSMSIIQQEARGVNQVIPPSDALKQADYDLWCLARRQYLLNQARAMGAL